MKLLYKLFRQDPESRDGVIAVTSGIGIMVNLLLGAVKIIIGLAASSIAIVSEGANNATDSLSSVITLVGTKIAGKHPDKEHPFGYRRIEYLTGLVVSVLVLVTGIEMLISSVKLVIKPEPINVSYVSIIIIAVSAVIKFFLGIYTIHIGKKTGSTALQAVGIDGRNDSFSSAISIVSSLVFIIFHISLDAYAGILISAFIIKTGFEVLKDTVSELIGRAGQKELADKLYEEIRKTDGVVNAADMMLHNYGPDTWSGSVNLEIDHSRSVGEVYQFIHELQLRIMHEYAVVMVFGIYGVDNDSPETKEIRTSIQSFLDGRRHVVSYHALYVEPGTKTLYCDFVVDYGLEDWNGLRSEFVNYMKRLYPMYRTDLTIETEYV